MTRTSSNATSRIAFSRCGERLSAPVITKLMAAALANPELLSLAAGFTDTATLPVGPIRSVLDNMLRRPGPAEYLQYGTNQGRPGLRAHLARRVADQDGRPVGTVDPDRLFITNGSQQALALATQVLCDPGDIVLVERPTYFVYLDVLKGLGVRPRSLPVDDRGKLDPTALQGLLDELGKAGELDRVKAVYLLGYFANPSSNTLSEEEKNQLAEVLRRRNLLLPVIEDAAYRELFFETPPAPRGVLALPSFEAFPRLYLGTLTKAFSTGLKVGFGECTSGEWLDRILYLKGQQDFGTANFNQAILEEILVGEELEAYLRGLRKHYRQKMQVLHHTLLEEQLDAAGWTWQEPQGGLYLWLRGPSGLNTGIDSPFCQDCLQKGVLYVPGELFYGDQAEANCVRLSFGVLDRDELREAGRRFAKAARAIPVPSL